MQNIRGWLGASALALGTVGYAALTFINPYNANDDQVQVVRTQTGPLMVWSLLWFAVSLLMVAGAASVVVVACWTVASTLFGLYATHVASYGTLLGGLAFVFVLMVYVYISAVTFLAGLQAAAHVGEGARRATRSSGPEHRRQDPA